jgi:hypothetical protein
MTPSDGSRYVDGVRRAWGSNGQRRPKVEVNARADVRERVNLRRRLDDFSVACSGLELTTVVSGCEWLRERRCAPSRWKRSAWPMWAPRRWRLIATGQMIPS